MSNEKTVQLKNAITLGNNQVQEITIRKANVSHLRGISLVKLFNLEADEFVKLLPRISEPALPEAVLNQMDISDFMLLVTEAVNFLAPSDTVTLDK